MTTTPQSLQRSAVAPAALIPAFVNADGENVDAACAALASVGGFAVERIAAKNMEDRIRKAAVNGARRILVAGGDGSISTAASALCGGVCELAILPAGTLNHLAQDLGLPEDLVEAARIATGSHTRSIDVAEVNGRLFLNTSSVGAYVTFVHTRERIEPRFGYWIASGVAALRILAGLKAFRVTMEVNGVERQYDTPLMFVGVGERELRLPLLGARIGNGARGLHVMVVRSRTRARLLALAFAAAARGVRAVAGTPALDSYVVDRLRIEPRRRMVAGRIAVDGEIVTVTPPLEYRLKRGALKVVAPAPLRTSED